MDYRDTKQVHIWIDRTLYDMCKDLVDNGLVYKSMSELVRDGMQMAYDMHSGYNNVLYAEIDSKYSPDQMTETRCKIDGTLMRLRVNARWMAKHGTNNLVSLIDDLHDPMLSLTTIGNRYGTKIELYNMHERAPDDPVGSDIGEGYKDTYAYKLEHGLPIEDGDAE